MALVSLNHIEALGEWPNLERNEALGGFSSTYAVNILLSIQFFWKEFTYSNCRTTFDEHQTNQA